jgi:diguanylate cyclase (GGDEF)-like protein
MGIVKRLQTPFATSLGRGDEHGLGAQWPDGSYPPVATARRCVPVCSLLAGLLVSVTSVALLCCKRLRYEMRSRANWEARLTALTHVDPVTSLPNRRALTRRLQSTLERLQRSSDTAAVVYLDLDDFKSVNDTFGHAGGDAALSVIGRRLQAGLRRDDMVARLGGDEFVILLESPGQESTILQIAERIGNVLREPLIIDGNKVCVTASIGVVLIQPGDDPTRLLQEADTAMYAAKRAGKDSYVITESSPS